jgi:hypothetical protein
MMRICVSLFVGLVLTTSTLTADVIAGVEYSLQADGRKWVVVHDAKTDASRSVIYVPDGEKLEHCTESFAIHTTKQRLIDLSQNFEETFRKLMEQFFPGKPLGYQVLDHTTESLFAEWWMRGTKKTDRQHGWIRLMNSSEGMVIFQFTTQNFDKLLQTKKTWEKILSDAHVKS